MIIDSHCHLEHESMASNLNEVVERALKNDVKYMLSISTTNESYLLILEIIKKYKNSINIVYFFLLLYETIDFH